MTQPVYVDREMWEKIVLNLLSNAFKFTFEGEIAVEMGVSADGQFAETTVRDTGVGIPGPSCLACLSASTGSRQRSRSFEGSGIALALVQELVKLHGGSIRAESECGKGTAFIVSPPFGTAHLPAERTGTPRSPASTSLRPEAYVEEALRWLPQSDAVDPGSPADRADAAPELMAGRRTDGARVLVADDNADMRNYIRRLLGARWTVEAVSDGQAALEAIRARKPDLVLMTS